MTKLFGYEGCKYCPQAEELLRKNKISFEKKDVMKDLDAKKELFTRGFRSVPVVLFEDGKVAHGIEELKKMLS